MNFIKKIKYDYFKKYWGGQKIMGMNEEEKANLCCE